MFLSFPSKPKDIYQEKYPPNSSMEWVRGDSIGCGGFSTVNLAIRNKSCSNQKYPSLMAVKSCYAADSILLQNEKEILAQLGYCPQIIGCFGDDRSLENNQSFYNLLLEYAPGGSLAHHIKKTVAGAGGGLKESDVRSHTRSILKGLSHLHSKGFVHCDLKLENVLVFGDGQVKIADFGLSKRTGEKQDKTEIRGTPLYMSPESVNDNEYESPGDVWSLGCAVVEMVTGKPAWNFKPGTNIFAMLIRIGVGDELPLTPLELCEEGKDFLSKCFVKDPRKRWTAEMLLSHPFVAAVDDDTVTLSSQDFVSKSPRGPFDFPDDWISVNSCEESELFRESAMNSSSSESSAADRIRQVVSDENCCSWSDSSSWVTVR